MRIRVLALAGAVALAGSLTLAAPEEKKAEMSPEMQAQMDAWRKVAAPGEHHKHLDAYAGNWKIHTKFWMDANQPPEESDGKAENTWVLGGRFLQQRYKGESMGEPFEGLGFLGYDNAAGEYSSLWMDNHGTMMGLASGTCSDGGKVHAWTGSYLDPATGATKSYRSVSRTEDATHYVFEMHETGPDGKEHKSFEIRHERM